MATPICITCGSTGKLVAIPKPTPVYPYIIHWETDPSQVAFICDIEPSHNEIWQVQRHKAPVTSPRISI